MQARRGARPVLQSEGGVLSLANGVSPPPSPCSRVHQPHLNPGLPAPQTCSPSTAPAPVHTPGLTTPCSASAPALWPLAFCLPSHCRPMGPCRSWPQSRANGSSPRETGLALRMDTVTRSFLDPGPLFWRPPAYLWEWQVGAGPARRPQSLCLSRPRSPYPHPAFLGWINGPEPWPGCLALVPCGLWPQAPWAFCRVQVGTVTEHR